MESIVPYEVNIIIIIIVIIIIIIIIIPACFFGALKFTASTASVCGVAACTDEKCLFLLEGCYVFVIYAVLHTKTVKPKTGHHETNTP
jgi:uncharacterized protein YpmB